MLQSSLEGGKEARTVSVENPKHQEDLKMYSQLPDYDDFQRYDMGIGGILKSDCS